MVFKYCLLSFSLLLLVIDSSLARNWQSQKCQQYKPKVPSYDMYKHLKISERKCKEYMYELSEREHRRKLGCTEKKGYYVIRGNITKPAEYPHMGALGWKTTDGSWKFLCGSSLISENFVLTSAHCTKTRDSNLITPDPQIVRLGVVNINDSKAPGLVDVKIKKIIRHPEYKPPKKYYDIALIKLETTVNFTKFVHPACLSTKSVNMKNQKFTVTGWGETENRTLSPNLLSATVDLFGSNCSKVLFNRNWEGPLDQQFCAGKLDGSVDTCRGDSGGPLQFKLLETKKDGSMHKIVGITTFGAQKCAQKHIPGVYTQVSKFIKWIEKHVWPEENKVVFPND